MDENEEVYIEEAIFGAKASFLEPKKKIVIDLEDEVMILFVKEKENLETIESLKSKGFESSGNAISESENQSENDCQVVEKECDEVENSKVIAPVMVKLNVSQNVSPTSVSKTSCASKNVENKTKRKRQEERSSNTSNKDLSSVSHLKLNKDVKRYSRKDLLSCNNSHLGETSSAYVCNDAMNVFCNSRLYDSFDENNLFIVDDICLWIIDSGCSKHMTGNRALLTNFVEKLLGTVHFGNYDFAVIAGYGDMVIGSMTIKKVYYVEGLGHNLFSVGESCDKGLEVDFRKSTCFIQTEYGVDLLTDEYFDSSKIMKSSTTNVETSNVEIPSNEEEVFHESFESFQKKSFSSSLNDDVQQSLEEVAVPSSNTQSFSNNTVPNVDEASTSHNVFNEHLEDAYFDASTSFHDPSNVHTFYQPTNNVG
uniref:Integrase, catalytic region, zinc finger, CCHC-type, peptidase aspartic, catalytic n=1 Tax=Tanacetum cinerariifolium TaxID=118510 RepID=A0A6L2MT29_TANCI|nr:integrase, catalytic region, zinc finger, CCHC-type, peptidase aspartic, catalytic [Tanacetum cinerariifolium]